MRMVPNTCMIIGTNERLQPVSNSLRTFHDTTKQNRVIMQRYVRESGQSSCRAFQSKSVARGY